MADISAIKTPNGTVYDLKDASARTNKADKADTVLTTTLSRGRKSGTTVGTVSIAFGSGVTASGAMSQAFGWGTESTGQCSYAEGYYTKASNDRAHAEGDTTTASGICSHAEGYYTQASGDYSHAEGLTSYATKSCSHAEGNHTRAPGKNSSASGKYNVYYYPNDFPSWSANTSYRVGDTVFVSTSVGGNIYAAHYYICKVDNNDETFDENKWLIMQDTEKNQYAEIVGNGTGPNSESNARALDWAGNEFLNGTLYIECDESSKNGVRVAKDLPMTGASASEPGASGLVPAPHSGDNTKFLRGDGTWQPVSSGGGGDVSFIILNGTTYTPTDSTVDLGNAALPEEIFSVEDGANATEGLMAGMYVRWQGTVYKTTKDIAQGDAFATSGSGQNLTTLYASTALNDLMARLTPTAFTPNTSTIDASSSIYNNSLPTCGAVKAYFSEIDSNLIHQTRTEGVFGKKIFTGDLVVSGVSGQEKGNTPYMIFAPGFDYSGVGKISYEDAGNSNEEYTQGRFSFSEDSPVSDGSDKTGYSETYCLPRVTVGLNASVEYDILTTKNAVTIAQGGTGATTASAARTALGLGDAAVKGVTDNSSSTDVTSSDTNLITGRTLYYAGYTKNAGTITGITMNGSSKGTSGVVDLGTVITSIPLTLSPQTTGFKISGGTTSKTLTVTGNCTINGVTDNSSPTAVTSSDTNLITGRTLYNAGYTKNTGTITGITMNGSSKGTSGVVDLGTVLTSDSTFVHTTGAESVGGQKTFTDNPIILKSASRYDYLYFNKNTNTNGTGGFILFDHGNATNQTTNRMIFAEYSPKSTADPANTGYYESYYLPAPTKGLKASAAYHIVTDKPDDVEEVSSPVEWNTTNCDSANSDVTVYKYGRIVEVHVQLKYKGSGTGWKTLATLASSCKPKATIFFVASYMGLDPPQLLNINTSGEIRMYGNNSTTTTVYGIVTYLV